MNSRKQREEYFRDCLIQLGMNHTGVEYVECSRLYKKLGVAKMWRSYNAATNALVSSRYQVCIASRYFSVISHDSTANTIAHEACHIADYHFFGDSDHGDRWRTFMQNLNQEPTESEQLTLDMLAVWPTSARKKYLTRFCSALY